MGAFVDHCLAKHARGQSAWLQNGLRTTFVETSAGRVRVHDSGSTKPCVVMAPDGPNTIEHYARLIELLSPALRVVCFDMPGFGYSIPAPRYSHALDEGARAHTGCARSLEHREGNAGVQLRQRFVCRKRSQDGTGSSGRPGAVADAIPRIDAGLGRSDHPVAAAHSGRGAGDRMVIPEKAGQELVSDGAAQRSETPLQRHGTRCDALRRLFLPGGHRAGIDPGNDAIGERNGGSLHHDLGRQRSIPRADRSHLIAPVRSACGDRNL